MTLKLNNVDVSEVRFNGSAVSELRLNGESVWNKCVLPLGLQKVGNPTIQNGIVSGFSTSDYLQFTQRGPDFSPGTTLVIKVKFDDVDPGNGIFGTINPLTPEGVLLRTGFSTNTNLWAYYAMRGAISSWTTSGNTTSFLQPNVWYWIRIKHKNDSSSYGKQLVLEASTDGTTWGYTWGTSNYDYEATIPTANYCLGCIGDPNTSGAYNVLRGSIDLNETYIEQEVGGQTLRYIPLVQEPSVPTGYTKVGEPVFVGTQVTCADLDNYLKSTQTLPSLANLEMQIKFNTASTYQMKRTECIFVCENVFNLSIGTNTNLNCWNWSAGTAYNLILGIRPYTTYYVKITIGSDGQTKTYYTSMDGASWNQVVQFVDTGITTGHNFYFFRHETLNEVFKGIIDLSETYIKIDGQYWLPPAQ